MGYFMLTILGSETSYLRRDDGVLTALAAIAIATITPSTTTAALTRVVPIKLVDIK